MSGQRRMRICLHAQTQALDVQAGGRQTIHIGAANSLRGPQGPPGISPTVEVRDIDGGHEIVITDAEGVHVCTVLDGESKPSETAQRLAAARMIALTGEVSGQAAFDGGADVAIEASIHAMTPGDLEEIMG